MSWDEFRDLMSGLSADTALGQIVQIRTEQDKEVLENFTEQQKRIHSEWQNKAARQKSEHDTKNFILAMQKVFQEMAGE